MLEASVRRRALSSFTLGLLLGGAATALAFWLGGELLSLKSLPDEWRLGVVTTVLATLLGREFGLVPIRLPENRRLVPETVFRLGPGLGPFQFGLEMGSGIRTYVPSAVPYMAVTGLVLLTGPLQASVIGCGFGLGRALMTSGAIAIGNASLWDNEWLSHRRIIVGALAVCMSAAVLTLAM